MLRFWSITVFSNLGGQAQQVLETVASTKGCIPAAMKPVLNLEAALCAEVVRSFGIDHAFGIER